MRQRTRRKKVRAGFCVGARILQRNPAGDLHDTIRAQARVVHSSSSVQSLASGILGRVLGAALQLPQTFLQFREFHAPLFQCCFHSANDLLRRAAAKGLVRELPFFGLDIVL